MCKINAFNLDQSKILMFGKELMTLRKKNFLKNRDERNKCEKPAIIPFPAMFSNLSMQ